MVEVHGKIVDIDLLAVVLLVLARLLLLVLARILLVVLARRHLVVLARVHLVVLPRILLVVLPVKPVHGGGLLEKANNLKTNNILISASGKLRSERFH